MPVLEELDVGGTDEELALDAVTVEELLETDAALLDADDAALELLWLLTEPEELVVFADDVLALLLPPPVPPLPVPPPPPPPPQAINGAQSPIKMTCATLPRQFLFGLLNI